MSIDACKAAFRAAVLGITPTNRASHGFTSLIDSRQGRKRRLEQLDAGFRYFEVVSEAIPRQAGNDLITCRWVLPMLVRVRYDYSADVDQMDTLIINDACAIIKALRSPSNWDQANSKLTAVRFAEDEIEPEAIGDDDRTVALIVSIPLTITYKDC